MSAQERKICCGATIWGMPVVHRRGKFVVVHHFGYTRGAQEKENVPGAPKKAKISKNECTGREIFLWCTLGRKGRESIANESGYM